SAVTALISTSGGVATGCAAAFQAARPMQAPMPAARNELACMNLRIRLRQRSVCTTSDRALARNVGERTYRARSGADNASDANAPHPEAEPASRTPAGGGPGAARAAARAGAA